jgi:hypothetical protein
MKEAAPAAQGEELADADDRRIGIAFRYSLGAVAVIAALGALAWLGMPGSAPQSARKEATIVPPKPRATIPVAPPRMPFTDVTRASGIDFVHRNGAYGEKLLPETMGGGVAVLDIDGDGHPDLLFVDSGEWPWHAKGAARSSLRLYRNDGKGHFSDVTQGSGLEASFYGMGVAIGDFDNDGRDDIVVTGVGALRLYRNLGGGKFADVTRRAGLAAAPGDWNTCAAFVDVDGDGLDDLFVCRYVQWSRDIDKRVDYRMTGVGRAYGPPNNFPGAFSALYRNRGDGTFEDISARAGIQVTNPATGKPMGKALGVVALDANGDGRVDLFVANDTVRNFLFLNEGGGRFREAAAETGVAYDPNGQVRGAMGADASFYRNDGKLALAVGNFANEMSALYVGEPGKRPFTDEAIVEGIGPATRLHLAFGVLFADLDLDGRPDLFQSNGHIEDEINKVQPSQTYAQRPQVFWNCGAPCPGAFIEVVAAEGEALAKPIVGRGAVYADLDGDGDLDLVLTQVGGPALVLRNDTPSGARWIRVSLEGAGKVARSAIGAEVEVTAGGITQRQRVNPTRSYLSQVERTLTFGLGRAERVDAVRIRWPDGSTQELRDPKVNATLKVRKEPAAAPPARAGG